MAVASNSTTIIEFVLNVIPHVEPEEWLQKQKLVNDDKIAVAGLLLFAEEPQIYLPKTTIKIYRYKTNELEGSRETLDFDPVSVEGPIIEQIHNAVSKTVEITEAIPILGEEGFEKITYPSVAIHEIITNAVLHRDYSINDDVHVRIFDNRIEVESPGTLPAHITAENILHERFARNPTIVRLINKFPNPPNKDVGEGLNTAFEAMRALRLKDPVVEQRENSVKVILRHEPLASPAELIMQYLETHPEINNSKAREICHIGSENVVKRIFIELMQSNLIEKIPDRRGSATAYRKKNDVATEQ